MGIGLSYLGLGLGLGLVVIGAGYGIGRLAAAAMEGTARQPEAAGAIRTTAIILAALIEGFTFFAFIVVFLVSGKVDKANWVEGSAGGHAALEIRADEAKVANNK